MTPKEVSEAVGCAVSTVREWINKGKLKATLKQSPFGSYYFIKPAEVERLKKVIANESPRKVGFPLGNKRK